MRGVFARLPTATALGCLGPLLAVLSAIGAAAAESTVPLEPMQPTCRTSRPCNGHGALHELLHRLPLAQVPTLRAHRRRPRHPAPGGAGQLGVHRPGHRRPDAQRHAAGKRRQLVRRAAAGSDDGGSRARHGLGLQPAEELLRRSGAALRREQPRLPGYRHAARAGGLQGVPQLKKAATSPSISWPTTCSTGWRVARRPRTARTRTTRTVRRATERCATESPSTRAPEPSRPRNSIRRPTTSPTSCTTWATRAASAGTRSASGCSPFLAGLFVLAWALNREYWKDVR